MKSTENSKLLTPALVLQWDCDGVLVMSEDLHRQKLKLACAEQGVVLEERHFKEKQSFSVPKAMKDGGNYNDPLHGAGDKIIYYWLLDQVPEVAKTLTEKQWEQKLLKTYQANSHLLSPREGVPAVVDAFAKLDRAGARPVVQGVVTSGIAAQLQTNLGALPPQTGQALAYFVTADDLAKGKPNPEPYLRGREKADARLVEKGSDPSKAIVFAIENSGSGVKAGLASQTLGKVDAVIHFVLPGEKPFPKEDLKPSQSLLEVHTAEQLQSAIETTYQRISLERTLAANSSPSSRRAPRPAMAG